jgi:CheY-like chemotaxis protein
MILVVEDNVNDSNLLLHELSRANLGHKIRVFRDGQTALNFLMQAAPVPYAVFLDLKMPKMSGLKLLQEIRNEPRFHALTVIVMTGSVDPHDAEMCARLGVSAFLPKPVNPEVFKRILGIGDSGYLLGRPVDPHFAEMASSML